VLEFQNRSTELMDQVPEGVFDPPIESDKP